MGINLLVQEMRLKIKAKLVEVRDQGEVKKKISNFFLFPGRKLIYIMRHLCDSLTRSRRNAWKSSRILLHNRKSQNLVAQHSTDRSNPSR